MRTSDEIRAELLSLHACHRLTDEQLEDLTDSQLKADRLCDERARIEEEFFALCERLLSVEAVRLFGQYARVRDLQARHCEDESVLIRRVFASTPTNSVDQRTSRLLQ